MRTSKAGCEKCRVPEYFANKMAALGQSCTLGLAFFWSDAVPKQSGSAGSFRLGLRLSYVAELAQPEMRNQLKDAPKSCKRSFVLSNEKKKKKG